MTFEQLGIIEPILKALEKRGYETPTPIQNQAIPFLLEGHDLLGIAQTGTGKTAAFTIPIIQKLEKQSDQHKGRKLIRALVVTPTRELALQIAESITAYSKFTKIKNTVVYGGVKQGAQTAALDRGVDILVATPGRLLDLMGQGFISLKNIQYFVLDEADHMLDMGFINDIKRIVRDIPEKRQSLFFSATMPPAIVALSKDILGEPKRVSINPEQTTAERVKQAVYFVSRKSKPKLLVHLLETQPIDSVLVFSRTKHGANKLVKILGRSGIAAEAIHGNKSQSARQRALNNFKEGGTKVLVATDIAARGIDVAEISLVLNYDLPNVPETYVHRIGRTGRAEASGIALSFCTVEEKPYLKDIEKLIKKRIPFVSEHPFMNEEEDTETPAPARKHHQPRKNKPGRNPKKRKSTNQRRGGTRREDETGKSDDDRNTAGGNERNTGNQRTGGNQRSGGNRRRGGESRNAPRKKKQYKRTPKNKETAGPEKSEVVQEKPKKKSWWNPFGK